MLHFCQGIIFFSQKKKNSKMAAVRKILRSFQFISDFILGIIENIPTNCVRNSGFKSTITNMMKA
jgi:hypothetical protein